MCGFEFHVLLNCIHYSRLGGFSPFILQHNCKFCLGEVQSREHQAKVFPYVYSTNSLPEGLEQAGIYTVLH